MTRTEKANESVVDSDVHANSETAGSEKASSDERYSAPQTPLAGSKETELMATIMLFLCLIALIVFFVSLTGRFFVYGEQFGNFRLQIAVILIPFALTVFRIGRWRWLAYSLTAASLWSLLMIGSVYLPAAQPPAGKQKLKIMSYNVLGSNGLRDEVLAEIDKADPDVIMVIEYTQQWHRRMAELNDEYPHTVLQPRWHGFGLGVFSKYPLSDSKIVQLAKSLTDNPMLITHVNFGDQKIRLCGFHALSPTNSFRLGLRNQQYEEVAEELSDDKVPTVVMGDFNSVPWSPFVKDFIKKTGYRDSRRGFGFHGSWHSDFTLLRIPIDHAFVSQDICVHSRYVGGVAGSDHMPIIFEVSTAR